MIARAAVRLGSSAFDILPCAVLLYLETIVFDIEGPGPGLCLAAGLVVWAVFVPASAITARLSSALNRYSLRRHRDHPVALAIAGGLLWGLPAAWIATVLLEGTGPGRSERADLYVVAIAAILAVTISVCTQVFARASWSPPGWATHRGWAAALVIPLALGGATMNLEFYNAQYGLAHALIALFVLAGLVAAGGLLRGRESRSIAMAGGAIVVTAVVALLTSSVSPSPPASFHPASRVLQLVDSIRSRLSGQASFPSVVDLTPLEGRWGKSVSGRGAELTAGLPHGAPGSVLLITIDALRADRVGFLGYDRPVTPFLDRLARRSVNFTQAYAQGPDSLGSIMATFTGRYPASHNRVRALSGEGAPVRELTLAETLRDAGFLTAGIPAYRRELLRTSFAEFGRGFERFALPSGNGPREADEVGERGLAHLRENRGRSSLLWMHFLDVHGPYPEGTTIFGDEDSDRYDAATLEVDGVLERFWKLADEEGLLDEFLVILHSDHGEEFGEHGGRFHGTSVFQEQIHVPLLIHLPSGPSRIVDDPVELVDLYPTVMEILGLDLPLPVHGDSLIPRLLGERSTDPAISQVLSADLFGKDQLAFIEGRRKALFDRERDEIVIYDLDLDPGERGGRSSRDSTDETERMSALARVASALTRHLPDPTQDEPSGSGEIRPPIDLTDRAQLLASLRSTDEPTRDRAITVLLSTESAENRALIDEILTTGPPEALHRAVVQELIRRPRSGFEPRLRASLTGREELEVLGPLLEAWGEGADATDVPWILDWSRGRSPELVSRAELAAIRAGADDEAMRLRFPTLPLPFVFEAWRILARGPSSFARRALIAAAAASPTNSNLALFALKTFSDHRDPIAVRLFGGLRPRISILASFDELVLPELGDRADQKFAQTALHRIYRSSTGMRRLSALAWLDRGPPLREKLDRLGARIDQVEIWNRLGSDLRPDGPVRSWKSVAGTGPLTFFRLESSSIAAFVGLPSILDAELVLRDPTTQRERRVPVVIVLEEDGGIVGGARTFIDEGTEIRLDPPGDLVIALR